jgi:hypothetical protein
MSDSQKLSDTIEKRIEEYKTLFFIARTLHYSIGVFGLTCSIMASSGFGGGDIPRYWAVGSGICYGLLAFLDPNSKYIKFSKAARVLEQAYLEHKYGNSPLIQSFGQAEELITRFEKLETNSQQQLDRVRDGNKNNGKPKAVTDKQLNQDIDVDETKTSSNQSNIE